MMMVRRVVATVVAATSLLTPLATKDCSGGSNDSAVRMMSVKNGGDQTVSVREEKDGSARKISSGMTVTITVSPGAQPYYRCPKGKVIYITYTGDGRSVGGVVCPTDGDKWVPGSYARGGVVVRVEKP